MKEEEKGEVSKEVSDCATSEGRLIEQRLSKANEIINSGKEAYAFCYETDSSLAKILSDFDYLESGEGSEKEVRIAGRLMAMRKHGKMAFADVLDDGSKLQVQASLASLGEDEYGFFVSLDVGDYVGIEGEVMRTRRGELTVGIKSFCLLSKSVRPLPEKWHGLKDVELRFRRRYLDLIMNPDSRHRALIRIKTIKAIRDILDEKGFLEVETPMMQAIPGGAAAKPFKTYHNALKKDLYMRVAPELYLKRLIVGGFDRVFELNRSFRNEGLSVKHNPEFTMLELYRAYADYYEMMDLVQELIAEVANRVIGKTRIDYEGKIIDLNPPWEKATMDELVLKVTGKELTVGIGRHEMAKAAAELEVYCEEGWGEGKILTEIFEKRVEETLWNPTIVLDYPVEVSPLARNHRSKPGYTERFEVIAANREIANAFSELTDPLDQRERFAQQLENKSADGESHPFDEDYLTAMEYGMPPTGGLGIGIDRLVMLLCGSSNIREVILFPHMR